MTDSISTALILINHRLDDLQALLTEAPVDVVTERFRAWKATTGAALADLAIESVTRRFDLLRGRESSAGAGRRATPRVFLDAAASRDFLTALKKSVTTDPGSVLRPPILEPVVGRRPSDILEILDLLERRLPRAFRAGPETERDVQDGFETLLVGADIPYERTSAPDFSLPALQTALELKICDRPVRAKELVAEINDEVLAYRANYAQIIFGIYDLGFIPEEQEFSGRFEAQAGVLIRVLKPQAGRVR